MRPQRGSLRREVEGEFEEGANIDRLVETLLASFLKSKSNYGLITDIKTDVDNVFRVVRDIISRKMLDIYALKVKNEIYLSKTIERFNKLYDTIRDKSSLKAKRDLVEIWDDNENKILHFLVPSLKRHFPIEYEDDREREEIIKALLEGC